MGENTNLVEYQHPELYDLENPDFEPDGLLYLAIAREMGGAILELGCGTGRFTIPLAQQGLEITGLDIAPEMLAAARRKAGALPIQWVEADARYFQLNRQFKFIFESGGTFMHMLSNDDQLAFLAHVRRHLAPGGRFVISLFFPHPERMRTDLEENDWFTYQDQQGGTVRVSGTDQYDQLRQVKTETAIRRVTSLDGTEIVYIAPLQLRYTFPQEMEGLLAQAGFKIIERFGAPDRSPLTDASPYLIYLCV